MDTVLYLLTRTYFGGLIWILFGIWMLRFIIQNPAEDKISQGGDLKGWAAGIFGIFVGLSIIVLKILGKL